jgi:hypothetical protein
MPCACFEGCAVRAICIPRSIEEIASQCFEQSKLESIEFESPSELKKIGDQAFFASHLKGIVIPRGVQTIGTYCFAQAPLKQIAFDDPSRLTGVGFGCFLLTQITPESLPVNVMVVACFPFGWDVPRNVPR